MTFTACIVFLREQKAASIFLSDHSRWSRFIDTQPSSWYLPSGLRCQEFVKAVRKEQTLFKRMYELKATSCEFLLPICPLFGVKKWVCKRSLSYIFTLPYQFPQIYLYMCTFSVVFSYICLLLFIIYYILDTFLEAGRGWGLLCSVIVFWNVI